MYHHQTYGDVWRFYGGRNEPAVSKKDVQCKKHTCFSYFLLICLREQSSAR